MSCIKTLLPILLAITILTSCETRQDEINYQPEAKFVVSPDSGNTTTIFHFDASPSLTPSLEDNPVFLRWDWDANGSWDKMYTTGGEYTHRFFKKGTYTIALEAATLLGRKDTTYTTIVINQGYSSPRASFFVNPDSANILTEFTFDASGSRDDEDSLDQLMFRWDFEGDQIWDTEFSSDPVTQFKYPDNAFYPVRLEVKDPQNMRNISIFDLEVTRLNDKIVPIILSECNHCTLEDTIRLDAGQSYIVDNPDAGLLYSWDIFGDNLWEMVNSTSPLFSYMIPRDGVFKIKLRVTDNEGLYMDTITKLEIFQFNTPPVADLVLANRYGNTSTNFYLHAKGSWDRETGYFDRILRWDLNDDGIWDEENNDQYEVWVQFDKPGDYPVAFQITDEQEKSALAYDTIRVFSGNRQTDILEDKRGGASLPDYYGTVLIGNTWWTQNNSRYVPPEKGASYSVISYRNETDSVYKYGYLYPYSAINDKFSPCPSGWRIPSLDDWNQLMDNLAPANNISDLLIGGSSELHLFLTGQLESRTFNNKGRIVHYYTTDVTRTGLVYLWYIDNLLKKNKSVLAGRIYSLPVRCVKDK